MNHTVVSIVVCGLIYHATFMGQYAYAEGGLGDSIDCTDVRINYQEDPTLTRDERLRLMDKAFLESLNKFELCQSAREQARAAGAAGNGGSGSAGTDGGSQSGSSAGGGGTTGVAGDSGDRQADNSNGATVASSLATASMSGTEASSETASENGLQAMDPGTDQDAEGIAEAGSKNNGKMTRANGQLPEDIPPAANDDALAAQIRYAAENEPDPVKSKQLWNEYRKYKGMPPKN